MAPKNGKATAVQPTDWTPMHVIEPKDYGTNTMDKEKVVKVKKLVASNLTPNLVVPPAAIEADWYRKNWICFYYHPFDIGMPFPWSKLTCDFLRISKASPAQLMPVVWRVLISLDEIENKYNLGINIHTLCFAYTIKRFNNSRITLIVRKKREPLILHLDVNDRGWREEYFFMEKSSLGTEEETSCFYDKWNPDANIEDGQYDAEGRLTASKVYDLDWEDRIFPNCLGRDVPNCTRVNVQEFVKKYQKSVGKKPLEESRTTAAKSVRGVEESLSKVAGGSVEIIGVGTTTVSTVDSKEQQPKVVRSPQVTIAMRGPTVDVKPKISSSSIAAVVSQNLKRKLEFRIPEFNFFGKDLFKRDRNSSGTNTSKTTTPATSAGLSSGMPSAPGSVKKPKVNLPPLSTKPDPRPKWDCNIDAPPSQMSELLPAFLMPQTPEQFSRTPLDRMLDHASTHALHAFQATLACAAECNSIANQQRFLVKERDNYRLKVAEMQKDVDDAIFERNVTQEEYDNFALSVQQDLNERHLLNVEEVAKKQVMIERIKMMIEHHKGESIHWDPEACIAIFERDYPDTKVNWGLDEPVGRVGKSGMEADGSSKVDEDIEKIFGNDPPGDDPTGDDNDQGNVDDMES